MRRLALRLLGVLYLPRLARCGKMPRGTRQVLTLCLCLCYPAPDNPYTKGKKIPGGTLAQILVAKFKGTIMRKPHGKGRESHAGSAESPLPAWIHAMMNETATPDISVIVPVYNAEAYLRRCLDSLLAQDFTQ